MKIFYSWQSDLPNNTNRGFIRGALEAAVAAVTQELDITDAERPPEVDEATKNTKGMVDIRESILRKISKCQIYVADLTPVSHTKKRKALPNPNVMYETGWASHRPGYDFIIGVMNTYRNKGPESLPFDLRGRRIIAYKLAPDADQEIRRSVRKQLTEELTGAIRENIKGVADKASAEVPIEPCPADPDDFSLWDVGSNLTMSVPNSFGVLETISIRRGPRVYARITPAFWPKGIPDALDIQQAPVKVEASHLGCDSGSHGTCELGFVRYWFEGRKTEEKSRETGSLALYIEEFGEYWHISDGPFVEGKSGVIISLPHVFAFWRSAATQSLAPFDTLGASKRRRIEIGVVGLSKVFMADSGPHHRPQSRKASVRAFLQEAEWDEAKLRPLLRKAYDELRSAFSLPRLTDDEFVSLVSGA